MSGMSGMSGMGGMSGMSGMGGMSGMSGMAGQPARAVKSQACWAQARAQGLRTKKARRMFHHQCMRG
jgi:hypothetical protein